MGTGGSGGDRHPGLAFLQTSPTAPQSRTRALTQGESAPTPRVSPQPRRHQAPPTPFPGWERSWSQGWACPALRGQHREAGKRAGSLPAQPGRPRSVWGGVPLGQQTPTHLHGLRSPPLTRDPPCPCRGHSCNEKEQCAWSLPACPRPQGPALGSVPCGSGLRLLPSPHDDPQLALVMTRLGSPGGRWGQEPRLAHSSLRACGFPSPGPNAHQRSGRGPFQVLHYGQCS